MIPQPLPLEPVEPLPMRDAYDATPSINTKCTFAQATSGRKEFRHLALALRLHAEAIQRQRNAQ